MALRKIVLQGEPCLTKVCRPVTEFNQRLHTLIDETSQPQTSGVYDFNGTQFVIYDLTDADVSCCAALLNDRVLNFVFTPQSDADFMVSAAQIIGTFTVL